MGTSSSLVSLQNRVESPFIIVTIGKYTFGHCARNDKPKLQGMFKITYPNFMDSITVVKVNGAVNTYTINMTYAITPADDPNMLEKVFSSISDTREVILSYGDWSMPSFIYKSEKALITKLQTKVNMQNSTISYIVQCTSATALGRGVCDDFPARRAKPSSVIMELLQNKRYGLQDIFTGMSNVATVRAKGFIASDDQTVQLEAKSCNILDYISYLVNCMVNVKDDPTSKLKKYCYFWASYDDLDATLGGTYFKVQCVAANVSGVTTFNTYEVDVGYPAAEFVTDFTVNNDDSWSLLYNYSKAIQMPEYTYSIDNSGKMVKESSDQLTRSSKYLMTTEAERNWWTLVTEFPITATLTIKGLLRPALLMSYVKVNVYFHGHKHTTSGLYIITKQQDQIDTNGYRTTLSLTRIGGDSHYA